MSIEERFDQLLIDNFKYCVSYNHDIEIQNKDNKSTSTLHLDRSIKGKKQIIWFNYVDIWMFLEDEYSMETKEVGDFISRRLENAYNFIDIYAQ